MMLVSTEGCITGGNRMRLENPGRYIFHGQPGVREFLAGNKKNPDVLYFHY